MEVVDPRPVRQRHDLADEAAHSEEFKEELFRELFQRAAPHERIFEDSSVQRFNHAHRGLLVAFVAVQRVALLCGAKMHP